MFAILQAHDLPDNLENSSVQWRILRKKGRFFMKKIFPLFLVACLLAGCAAPVRPTEPPQTVPATVTLPAPSEDLAPTFPADSDAVYDGCITNGNVTALSDQGCTVNVCLLEDLENGASIMIGAAPGEEDKFPSVSVRFRPGCVFVKVDASLSTGALCCEAATAADVREQTYVVVHGEVLEDGSIQAETVYLYRVVP